MDLVYSWPTVTVAITFDSSSGNSNSSSKEKALKAEAVRSIIHRCLAI